MAKKTFNNLKPKKKTKPSDSDIDKALDSMDGKKVTSKPVKQKLIQFNIKLPENLYNALDTEAQNTGLSKKAIVVNALWDKLKDT